MAFNEIDVEAAGHRVHAWEGGAGFPILMLHGSGPGAGTIGNWRLVLEPLAARYRILATDLIGFGQSARKKTEPYFDPALWLAQAEAMLGRLPAGPVGIIGHSLSGALALRLAARQPERVAKALTTGSMGARFKPNRYTEECWSFPETKEALRSAVGNLVFDTSVISEEFLDNRMKILHGGDYGPYFRAMFAGDKQRFIDAAVLSDDELSRVRGDVIMMHGRDDKPFPCAENTLALAPRIARADVMVIARCGHSPALEHPEKLLAAAHMLFG
ncbi:MAG: alpha/beta fold hydrolase [Alphaproteobacteria bacterium]